MTSSPWPPVPSGPDPNKGGDAVRASWGWFLVLGILGMLCGMAALTLTVTATIVSVTIIGLAMMAIGAIEVVIGFRARSLGRALHWEFTGLLYLIAGLLAVIDPVPASVVITLLLGAGLLAAGVVRLITGFRAHDGAFRAPLLLAGAVTTLLGLVIVVGWPGNSMLILGTLLGVDLLFTGAAWIVFGLRLRPKP